MDQPGACRATRRCRRRRSTVICSRGDGFECAVTYGTVSGQSVDLSQYVALVVQSTHGIASTAKATSGTFRGFSSETVTFTIGAGAFGKATVFVDEGTLYSLQSAAGSPSAVKKDFARWVATFHLT